MYHCLIRAIPSRKGSIKAPAKSKTSVYVLTEICHQRSKLGPKLIDIFQDLESPPSSVLAVMKNRWLSNGFKETALQTAIWSVLKAKRRLLR